MMGQVFIQCKCVVICGIYTCEVKQKKIIHNDYESKLHLTSACWFLGCTMIPRYDDNPFLQQYFASRLLDQISNSQLLLL